MVANFLKKYWLGLLLFTLLALLLIFLIPIEERKYFDDDFKRFESAINKLTAIIAGVVLLCLFLYLLTAKPSITRVFINFGNMLLLWWPLWIWLKTIFLYGALQLNKINPTVDPPIKYVVLHITTKYKSLYLYDMKEDELVRGDAVFESNRVHSVKDNTIFISCSKGLFGYRFNPVVQK